jgi:hypothetical protein
MEKGGKNYGLFSTIGNINDNFQLQNSHLLDDSLIKGEEIIN